MTKADNALAIAQRLSQRLSQGNAHIFIRVMIINLNIPRRFHIQIHQAVGRNLMQHVIQKRNACGGDTGAIAVEIEAHLHIGFACGAMDAGGAGFGVGEAGAILHRRGVANVQGVAGLHKG
jgi:hypothetical protein